MNLKKFVLAVAFVAIAAQAKNYGMAGCGLGSVVIGKGGGQISASTTNQTSYTTEFGITSGTSNCTDDGVAMSDRQLEMFTEANFESLKQEIAQGQGENMDALASLMGCSIEQSKLLSSQLQSDSQKIVSDTPQNLLFSIRAVETNSNLCTTTR